MIKTKSKRVIIDPTNNPALEAIFRHFENYYCGMTRAEILKMAFINFYQTHKLQADKIIVSAKPYEILKKETPHSTSKCNS